MIVLTLEAKSIKPGARLILTECEMVALGNGDQLHCKPDIATGLAGKYAEHLKLKGEHWDRPGELCGQGGDSKGRGRWHLERYTGDTTAAAAEPAPAAPKPVVEGKRTGRR